MIPRITPVLVVFIMVMIAPMVMAQEPEPEVVVGEVGFPERVWGRQSLEFQVTNNTDWLKFLTVETEVVFEGSYVSPHRVTRSNFVLEPEMKLTVDPIVEIPGNFGQMSLWLRIYDVVDTVDDMSLGVQVYEQPFRIKFTTPEAILPYFEERLSLPPMVGHHGTLDNEFHRLMIIMLAEGKTLEEIATLCEVNPEYVQSVAMDLTSARLLEREGDVYRPAIAVISHEFAVAGRQLVDRLSGQMVEQLTQNLSHLGTLRDSLAQAGVYSNDSANFIEGGTMLYAPYPLVGGLYLWKTLGQMFITGNRQLDIFQRTDPCNAKIGYFTYLVQGGDYYVGNHFYLINESRSGFNLHFGDRIPEVECRPGFERKIPARQNVDWNYATQFSPDPSVYDTTLINPALHMLDQGIEPILRGASTELREMAIGYGHKEMSLGLRYWFWNLTASRIAATLVEAGTLTRPGNGQYRLMEKRDRPR